MPAVPLPAAADALGVSTPTLRRWIASGAPVARRGRRGRGNRALIDPAAIAAWRASQARQRYAGNHSPNLEHGGRAIELAAQAVSLATVAAGLPDVIAAALVTAFDQTEGLPKQRMAGFVAGCWYLAAVAVMDHLRERDPTVPDVDAIPLAVDRLRKLSAA